jgi:hypothetical protein
VLAIPGVGRIQANCGSGSTAAVRIVNTRKAMLFLWPQGRDVHERRQPPVARHLRSVAVGHLQIAELIVRSEAPRRVTVIHFAPNIAAGHSCTHVAIAERIRTS